VQSAITREALVELIKEETDMTGKRPVTDAELEPARDLEGYPVPEGGPGTR
jgi:hypothetical protein